jgi:hypothetical protein
MLWNGYSIFESLRGIAKPEDYWKNSWETVFDGGSRYWSIKYIIDKKTFIDFGVNGVS